MKKIKTLIAALFVLCGSSLFAADFDWSQCWCNYGAGIKQGDKTVSVDFGLDNDFWDLIGTKNYWAIPAVVVDFEMAQPIWKLPFTFGGYAGYRLDGYKGEHYEYISNTIYLGGIAAYHVMLPPKNLDVYVASKVGCSFTLISSKDDFESNGDPFDMQFHEVIGASWYFNDGFGINLELGYPLSKFGIIFKF